MADIKTRDAVKGTIKTIDKAAVASERMKSAYSKIKDKAEQGYYAEEGSATEYAADRVSAASERITNEGVHQFNKQGQKAVKTTKDNIVKAKDKLSDFKQKRAAKAAEKRMSGNSVQTYRNTVSRSADKAVKGVNQAEKTITQTARSGKKTIKTAAKGTVKTTQKSVKTAQATSKAAIKTAEHTAKATQAAAKASVKAAQRAAQAARVTARAAIAAVKAAVKATAAAVKAIIAGTKALIAAIAAGGWVAVVVILVICLIGLLAHSRLCPNSFSHHAYSSGVQLPNVIFVGQLDKSVCINGLDAPPKLDSVGTASIVPTLYFLYNVTISEKNGLAYLSNSSTYKKYGILVLSEPGLPSTAHISSVKKKRPNPACAVPPISAGLVHNNTTSPSCNTLLKSKLFVLLQIISLTLPALNKFSSSAVAK